MSIKDSIKPLVDRIVNQPIQFEKAKGKDNVDLNPHSYIVIGKIVNTDNKIVNQVSESTLVGDHALVDSGHILIKPKSFQEALKMYTSLKTKDKRNHAGNNNILHGQCNGSSMEGSICDTDKLVFKKSSEVSSDDGSSSETFHEANDFLEDDENNHIKNLISYEEPNEDLGECLTKEQETCSDNSYGSQRSNLDSTLRNNSENSILTELNSEHDTNLDLILKDQDNNIKLNDPNSFESGSGTSSSSVISDIDDFYQYNENIKDCGTNHPQRIIKNWGAQLSYLKPRGLLNHGVTCYQNAAVQALLHVPALQHYLFDILRNKYQETIKRSSVSYILAETSKSMWIPDSTKGAYINPKKLIARLDDINCMMSVWNQEDSHEYLMSLISRLQEDSVPKGKKLNESIIYDIFGGLLQQNVKCNSCDGISTTEQPFYDLSLYLKSKKQESNQIHHFHKEKQENITCIDSSLDQSKNLLSNTKNKRRYSIEKSIRDFFNPELIKKVDKEGYVCEKCHKTTNAIKRNTILRAPETLLLHLKKFRFNGTSSSKMKQPVSYPMFLNLSEYCNDISKTLPVKYQLISVVVHEGRSLSSGHYIAHCKQPDGSWATYDDEYINKISEKEVLKDSNAYYLIYTRLTPKTLNLTKTVCNSELKIPTINGTNTSSSDSMPRKRKRSKNESTDKHKKQKFKKY